jgi:hypothetical protein
MKRSGRDEPMWVVIHMYMVATLRISLYSYFYLKLAKMLYFSYYHLCFLFNKIREQEGRGWGVRGKVAQRMYTHASKCKNDKILEKGIDVFLKVSNSVLLTNYLFCLSNIKF